MRQNCTQARTIRFVGPFRVAAARAAKKKKTPAKAGVQSVVFRGRGRLAAPEG
jgi:hypothetical protein